jgi:hypothetical protein
MKHYHFPAAGRRSLAVVRGGEPHWLKENNDRYAFDGL